MEGDSRATVSFGPTEGSEELETQIEEAEDGALFRYPLRYETSKPKGPDPLAEFIRRLLRDLLSVVRLQGGERDLEVEGFRFLGPDRAAHPLFLFPGYGATQSTPHQPSPPWPSFPRDGTGGKEKVAETGSHLTPGTGNGLPLLGLVRDHPGGERDLRAPGSGSCSLLFRRRENASLYEPRLELLARALENILSLVQLECEGRPVEVDGFRLRRLSDWADVPVAKAEEVILHAANHCQLDCRFCYHKGSVITLENAPSSPEEEWKRLEARVRLYRPRARRGLFPTFGGPHEALAHPRILPLLRSLRKKTDAPFRLSTNGCVLEPGFIAELSRLGPIYLDVSLNSSDPARRSFLMGDPRPETAISSLPRLAEAGIPFAVTGVAWPEPSLEEMLEDLERTCLYAAASGARQVQVNLPGYSRFFSPRPIFDTERVWGAVVRRVEELREGLPCPVVLSPALYEENLTRERKNLPEVIGVVPGSPAASWGLRPGDVIQRLNGIRVLNRPQARDLLTLLQQCGRGSVSLLVERGGKAVELVGEVGPGSYPFDLETGTHLGAVFMGSGLRLSHLRDLEALIHRSGARRVLFLTSRLVRPTLVQMLRENPLCLPDGVELRLSVPENRFFGGNIMLGDLLVVQDFIDHLREWRRSGEPEPDLVVIPSSPFHLSGWGRDLTGRVYLDIARETGMRVELLECEPAMD
ncbi:MAG: radical SAM protein [Actinomycetota bacterium]